MRREKYSDGQVEGEKVLDRTFLKRCENQDENQRWKSKTEGSRNRCGLLEKERGEETRNTAYRLQSDCRPERKEQRGGAKGALRLPCSKMQLSPTSNKAIKRPRILKLITE